MWAEPQPGFCASTMQTRNGEISATTPLDDHIFGMMMKSFDHDGFRMDVLTTNIEGNDFSNREGKEACSTNALMDGGLPFFGDEFAASPGL